MYVHHSGTNSHQYPALPTLPSSSANSNGRTSKKRRTTVSSSRPVNQAAPPPTPTSATHPPKLHTVGLPDSTHEANPHSAISPATSLPPFTPTSTSGLPSSNLNLPFSPNFSFSPLPQIPSLAPTPTPGKAQPHQPPPHHLHDAQTRQSQDNNSSSAFDSMLSHMPTPYDQQATPGAASASGGSVHTTESDKDPFMSLLEQLAENEASQGGPSELDYFLSGQSG
jgi:hypothetical protein